MFLDGLDELDQKIVKLLIQNARMSYSEIGQKIGISRVAVKMRVQALEKKGISRIWAILRDFFPARRILRPVCPLRNKGQCVFLKGLHVAQIAL